MQNKLVALEEMNTITLRIRVIYSQRNGLK